ncbi:ATP-dependent DNA helicase RecG [uncultured Microscilla sp.]|uniref:ATP-dependent DNA helicase RecG n=1 Tax=uncultured Microscilla sp. TaxID=432653 RepID=UPI002635DCAE|nr:ATP-dependent DNA helicase RecG [uncultured Microscilla sp.]
MSEFFSKKIEFLKGVGPAKGELLNKELGIFTYSDLILYYPFKHEDRTKVHRIAELNEGMTAVQLSGRIIRTQVIGEGHKKRLVAYFGDGTGEVELIWFKGVTWMQKQINANATYLVFGKPQFFNHKFSIAHPEIELLNPAEQQSGFLQPVYTVTEKMKRKYVYSKTISKMLRTLLPMVYQHIEENLSEAILQRYRLIARRDAVVNIHFPKDQQWLKRATTRLKFEELFYIQLKLLKEQKHKKKIYQGQTFKDTSLIKDFYEKHLPFELTDAQKRVCREIYRDMASGKQMNRLLQGDVGSGKTIVAFISMLSAIGSGAQACMVAPTEILAEQHYQGLKKFADKLGITIDILTGSTRTRDRRVLHARLENGNLKILVGTHALFEDKVQFDNLGLCIVDEQHRFGVEQRSKLWKRNSENLYPHILVMTATPIPRTLAMTLYGDLDVSVIDELPAGRKPIKTVHRYDAQRLRMFGFLREQIALGRQVYIVYPLIEESETLEYKNLMDGHESIQRAFPDQHLSIVHGQMSSVDKEFEMQRFKKGETQIMVATTVIEVGVDVPNATVIVIENAERFGLSQLHQLRGRVGRGAEQSYCILMTDYKISKEGRTRLETMVKTNNGFEIADVDLKLRGPGNMMGTQQSGLMNLQIADLAKDGKILQEARKMAQEIIEEDPELESLENSKMKEFMNIDQKTQTQWSRIS